MGIASAVAALADAVAAAHAPLSPSQRRLHAALHAMPEHLARGDLGAWEAAYQAVDGEDGSLAERLFDVVFDAGRHNLYRAFDAEGTAAVFGALLGTLAAHGVAPPAEAPPTRW